MVASVELLLDPAGDADLRAVWTDLIQAGLPSAGRHTGATNAPHVTLAVAGSIEADRESAITRAARATALPLSLTLGGLLVFGRGPFVLARQVVVTAELLDLQRRVAAAVGAGLPHTEADHWTPHLTLARRVPADQLGRAVALAARPESTVRADAVRRWDGARKVAWTIAP